MPISGNIKSVIRDVHIRIFIVKHLSNLFIYMALLSMILRVGDDISYRARGFEIIVRGNLYVNIALTVTFT